VSTASSVSAARTSGLRPGVCRRAGPCRCCGSREFGDPWWHPVAPDHVSPARQSQLRSRWLGSPLLACPIRVLPCPQRRTRRRSPWSQAKSHGGGGGNRTRVLQLLIRPSPSAAGRRLSGAPLLPATTASRIRRDVPDGRSERPSGEPCLMTPAFQPAGLRLGGRRYFLRSERELRLGVCFWFRLFYVAPETTARFSRLDDRSRNRSPPSAGN